MVSSLTEDEERLTKSDKWKTLKKHSPEPLLILDFWDEVFLPFITGGSPLVGRSQETLYVKLQVQGFEKQESKRQIIGSFIRTLKNSSNHAT